VIAGYTEISVIASGPQTIVHKARAPHGTRWVVIKSLREGISQASVAASFLRREASVLAELTHPNVVLFLDFQELEARPYVVLEYVEGETVRSLIRKTLRMEVELAVAIGIELLRALEYVHMQGYAHRDVKPDNILVSKNGNVKLADFGLAGRLFGQKLQVAGANVATTATVDEGFGTPAYMAPEQVLGDSPSAPSDLFSVGVVLYEMLSGRRPFEGAVRRTTEAARLRNTDAIPLSRVAPEVSGALAGFVMRLIEKRADERFSTAERAGEELRRIASVLGHGAPSVSIARCFHGGHSRLERGAQIGAAARGLASIGAAFTVLTGLLVFFGRNQEPTPGNAPLALAPKEAASLRVVADPWAEVWVDGEKVETTPFSKPIPLSPHTHYVVLKHPNARSEQREIHPRPGELVMLEVTMEVEPGDAGAGIRHGAFWNPGVAGADQDGGEFTREAGVPRSKMRKQPARPQ
jgi:eukaryotic-like serine/threonine-protein kinase